MALTASAHSAFPSGPSWDETIVPSLRKRLETESRILTKRLSTISITDQDPAQLSNRTPSPNDNPDLNSQRPSAIPRPSYSSRSPASPPQDPPRKPGRPRRKRTLSTPFPFNDAASPTINGHSPTTVTSPSASTSGSTSPRVQSPSLARAAPSRIPTVSPRARSGSQSSQNPNLKSSLPPSHKFQSSPPPLPEPVSPAVSLLGDTSSSSLARQRIVDERPPFTNEPPPNVLAQEFAGRPSAEEERMYQHWYRGDVSRNGGVGEYRVGRRMEMLDIAHYGHPLRDPAGRNGTSYEEPIQRSEAIGIAPRKRAESVSSRERASIYIDPQEEDGAGRVLDEMPLTDIEADETDYSYVHEPPTEFGMHQLKQQQQTNGAVQAFPTNHDRGHSEPDASTTLPTRLPSAKPQSRIPQAQVRSQPRKEAAATITRPAASSEPSTPVKPKDTDRGRQQPSKSSRAKPPTKAQPQKRSKSAGDALKSAHDKRDSTDYSGLADAVPETSSPRPRDGNWDEVILPTVARRMGIEYEKEDPVAAAKRRERQSRIAPAPGTFGYDHSKYKPPRDDIPMGEFGQQRPEPEELEAAPPTVQTVTTLRPRRGSLPSPAPFSHYMTSPSTAADSAPIGDGRFKERQDMPQILVTAPTRDERRTVHVEEGENSGCCKCVVM